MFFSKTFSAAAVLALASSVAAVLKTEFVNHAVVTLDLNARHVVPVPGGTKLGVPITHIDITSDVQFNATCTGYSWTTTFAAGTDTEYIDVEVRLVCQTADEVPVPFYVLETGSGKDAAHALRRIHYEIGPPYEHMRAEFFVAEVVTPAPNLTVDVYRVTQ